MSGLSNTITTTTLSLVLQYFDRWEQSLFSLYVSCGVWRPSTKDIELLRNWLEMPWLIVVWPLVTWSIILISSDGVRSKSFSPAGSGPHLLKTMLLPSTTQSSQNNPTQLQSRQTSQQHLIRHLNNILSRSSLLSILKRTLTRSTMLMAK